MVVLMVTDCLLDTLGGRGIRGRFLYQMRSASRQQPAGATTVGTRS
jgi:hypothetical protein